MAAARRLEDRNATVARDVFAGGMRQISGVVASSMGDSADVLILGGGVIGLSIAYYLAKAGLKPTLVDRGAFGQESSWAGAGMLPGNSPRQAKTPLGRLKGLASEMFPSLSAELRDLTGVDNGFLRCGGLEVRLSEEDLEARRLQAVQREEAEEGHTGQVLDRRQLRALEPELSPYLPGAIYFPNAAQIRNPWHVRALVAACGTLGVRLRPQCGPTEILRQGQRITQVRCSAGCWAPGQVVVCAGAWSDQLLQPLGLSMGVKPVRGQMVLVRAAVPRVRTMLLAGPKYLVPRGDGRMLLGSTEEDAGFVKENTPTAVTDLLDFGRRLVPGMVGDEVERSWSGLRPGSPDKKPILGPVPGIENLWIATGHFRAGLQLSPITGLLMANWLTGKPLPIDPMPFLVERLLHAEE